MHSTPSAFEYFKFSVKDNQMSVVLTRQYDVLSLVYPLIFTCLHISVDADTSAIGWVSSLRCSTNNKGYTIPCVPEDTKSDLSNTRSTVGIGKINV